MSLAETTGPRGDVSHELDLWRPPENKLSPRLQNESDVVVICPNEAHRRVLLHALAAQHANVVSQLALYPAYNHLLAVIDLNCDAFLIEADTDAEAALNLVETICDRKPSATVIVYSGSSDPTLLMSSMRAGAREFLTGTIPQNVLGEALLRATARRAELADKKVRGKILVFWGAKGGSGVTTLATNFAITLREESGGGVALLDLHPELGDVAVLLGITPRFTIAEALNSPQRLDKDFVSTLMTSHRTGVAVLAAPDVYGSVPVEAATIGKLVYLVGAQFPYVVVDAGMSLGPGAAPLFQMASTIYLVTQADIPSLRSSQRFVSHLQTYGAPSVELVLNRYDKRRAQFDDEELAKTIGIPPKWKVPNDYAAARRAADAGAPVVAESHTIAESLRHMARAACGKVEEAKKKRKGSLFG